MKVPNLSKKGFTIVEVLVSMAVLIVLLTIIAQVLGSVQKVWSSANSKVAQFREARRAMERISNNLRQASLNTYLHYYYGGSDPLQPPNQFLSTGPQGYVRYSELQFVCGPARSLISGGGANSPGHAIFFQAPLGGGLQAGAGAYVSLPTALSACGYYLQYGTDRPFRPEFLNQRGHPERTRFRLIEYRPPIQNNVIYDESGSSTPGVPSPAWYQNVGAWSRPVAENIVMLVFSPKRAIADGSGDPRDIAPNYSYDSAGNGIRLVQSPQDYQLPPMIEVTLIAVDETSAERLAERGTPNLGNGLFTNASDSRMRADIDSIEQQFISQRINYRVFTTTVALRSSKWGL
jgi:uncharacterized protein (TIGR02599 family)